MSSQAGNPSQTLFLDRDGVINKKRDNDYVKTLSEWEWRTDFLESIPKLAKQFQRIVIVTNQRGISRGLMTEGDLAHIHGEMLKTVQEVGGRIDGIFYCPHDKTADCLCRKPKTGLALQAQAQFPDIDFLHSILIGDSESDIKMGHRLGMKTYLLTADLSTPTIASKTILNISDIL